MRRFFCYYPGKPKLDLEAEWSVSAQTYAAHEWDDPEVKTKIITVLEVDGQGYPVPPPGIKWDKPEYELVLERPRGIVKRSRV